MRPFSPVRFSWFKPKWTEFCFQGPGVAQGSHNDHGGSQNHPPSAFRMIAAVPLSANAAVNRQISAARNSWSVSDRKLFKTTAGKSKFSDNKDSSLPVETSRKASRKRLPRLKLGATSSAPAGSPLTTRRPPVCHAVSRPLLCPPLARAEGLPDSAPLRPAGCLFGIEHFHFRLHHLLAADVEL